jgi:hypothetical protein
VCGPTCFIAGVTCSACCRSSCTSSSWYCLKTSRLLTCTSLRTEVSADAYAEYDIASLYMDSFYCFVTKACVRRPGAAARVKRRRNKRRTLLAGAAGELAGATRLRKPGLRAHAHSLFVWIAARCYCIYTVKSPTPYVFCICHQKACARRLAQPQECDVSASPEQVEACKLAGVTRTRQARPLSARTRT